jgi:hypothetical protein
MLPHSAIGQNRKSAWTNQAAHLNAVKEVTNAYQSGQLGRQPTPSDPMRLPDLIKVKNISGADQGFGAILQLKDYALTPTLTTLKHNPWFEADVPDDIFATFAVLWEPIKNGDIGKAVVNPHIVAVKYASADGTPAAKQRWGIKPGETELKRAYPGFKIHRVADYGSEKIVWATPEEINNLHGKRASNVSKGSSGDFTVWLKTGSSFTVWAASSITINCECLGAAYNANKWAKLECNTGQWIAGPIECAT